LSAHLLEAPIRFWKCPSCRLTDRTQRADVHTQFHPCPALGNVAIPLVEVQDPDAKVRARQIVVPSAVGPGNAAVRTERLDGSNDTTVFPRPAVAITTT
jgi:hypothetical protein